MSVMRWSWPLAMLALLGCARETGFAANGESCVRSTECQAGLACVAGQCTSDLAGLEGGTLPPIPVDAGPRVDAGMDASVDAGPPPPDAGPRDGGPGPIDSGPRPMDSGPPPMPDSGPPPTPDSGPPPTPDSGPAPDGGP